MAHRLDVEKAIQAVGVLLRREGKTASRLRILKLLYIADRKSLATTGSLILDSKLVAMKHGPLHSEVYDLINGRHLWEAEWSKHFRNQGRTVVMEAEPGTGKLSLHEIDILNAVVDERAALDDWGIADETHQFGEWKKHYYADQTESTSRPIPIEDVIDATGREADKESIVQDLKDAHAFEAYFDGLCR